MLLVQGRGGLAVLPAVTAVLLHHMLWIYGLRAMLLVQGRGEVAVVPAVTAGRLYHNAMDIWTEGKIRDISRYATCNL